MPGRLPLPLRVGAVAVLAAGAVACTQAGPAGAQTGSRTAHTESTVTAATHVPSLSFVLRANGFGQAVLVTNSHDSTARLFVLDRGGRVWLRKPGATRPSLYLDLRARVNHAGDEQGLLGLAFYPDFRGHPRFYVAYTRSDGALQISRFLLPGYTVSRVNPAIEQLMFAVPHPTYSNHNAGMLAFGRDGDLYISTGDGGGAGDPFHHAHSLASLNGKILRIDIRRDCTGHHYCVPADYPFVHTTGARHEIWDRGLRNPWRFSIDPVTGNLWIGDVGQDRYEEVDVSPYGQKGIDFGWSCREANAIYNPSQCFGNPLRAPVAVIPHPAAEALIGGVVYRGRLFASVMGPRYIVGDYITGTVWTMPVGGRLSRSGHLSSITSIGTTQGNEVYATTLTGGLYQMIAR
jgi:glucose/arabinose dehydrogenase